jgi:anaerobic selenocysteine-containing dehydrogenase
VFPDSEKIHAALRTLDVLALFDIRRHETAEFATHLLPVADQFERNDMPAFYDTVFPFPFTQYLPQVVAPSAERRGMWRIMADLGDAMGLPLGVDSAEHDDVLLARAASRSRVPFEELRTAPVGVVGENAPGPGWLIPDLLPQRLDLAPTGFVAQLADLALDGAPADPEQGLVLINRRLPRQVNSMLQHVPSQLRPPHPTLLMNPADASARSLASGDRVEVGSVHGRTQADLEVDESIRPGVVSLPHAWGDPDVNRLTSDTDGVDPVTGMPLFSGIPVFVQPAGG